MPSTVNAAGAAAFAVAMPVFEIVITTVMLPPVPTACGMAVMYPLSKGGVCIVKMLDTGIAVIVTLLFVSYPQTADWKLTVPGDTALNVHVKLPEAPAARSTVVGQPPLHVALPVPDVTGATRSRLGSSSA